MALTKGVYELDPKKQAIVDYSNKIKSTPYLQSQMKTPTQSAPQPPPLSTALNDEQNMQLYYDLLNSAFTQQNAYAQQQREAEERAQRLAVENAVYGLEAQKPKLQEQTNAANNAAYISNRLGTRNIGQQLSAAGLTGGMSETAAMRQAAMYGELVNSNNAALQGQLGDIDRDITNVKFTGDLSSAQTASAYYDRLSSLLGDSTGALLNAYGQERQYTQQEKQQRAQQMANNGWTQLERGALPDEATLSAMNMSLAEAQEYINAGSSAEKRDLARYNGERMLSAGIMPSAFELEAMGLTIDAAQQYINKMMSGASTSGTGGGGSQSNAYSALNTFVSRFNSGDYSIDVINGLLSAGYTMDALRAAGYTGSTGDSSTGGTGGGIAGNTYMVQGYGYISAGDVASLLNAGELRQVGYDAQQRPIYERIPKGPGSKFDTVHMRAE